MNENQSEHSQPLDLTLFARSIFDSGDKFDLDKPVKEESFFEPINNGWYGFCIPLFQGTSITEMQNGIETIDITYEDLTDLVAKMESELDNQDNKRLQA